MITFLRKMRKSLIDSGSTQKYLLYAIGEIALVVIGILIALQINSWNENLKNKKEESFYLNELKDEFEANRKVLDKSKEEIQFNLDKIEQTLSYMDKPLPDSLSTYSLLGHYYGLSVPVLEFSEGALNELLSTGKLSLISNRTLRRELSDWKIKVETANIHLAKILKFREEELRPYMIECCPRGDAYRSYHLKVFRDNKFQTIIELYELMLEIQMNLKRDPLYELIDSILTRIESEQ